MSGVRDLLDRPRPSATVRIDEVEVTFRALRRADYEVLQLAHTDDEGRLGDLDGVPFLAALAAACAEGEETLTPAEWSTVVAEHLTAGEAATLTTVLIGLNAGTPRPGLGKD